MTLYIATILEGTEAVEEFVNQNEDQLLFELQMFFVEHWSDNQILDDPSTLAEAQAMIQRFCATKSINELWLLLWEIKSEFKIQISTQEI